MAITDSDRIAAEARMQAELKNHPRAIRARYDRRASRIVIGLDNGLELAFPPRLAQGLETASPTELSNIEISPLGDGLHWPAIDADVLHEKRFNIELLVGFSIRNSRTQELEKGFCRTTRLNHKLSLGIVHREAFHKIANAPYFARRHPQIS